MNDLIQNKILIKNILFLSLETKRLVFVQLVRSTYTRAA